jgi:hypothetical protein
LFDVLCYVDAHVGSNVKPKRQPLCDTLCRCDVRQLSEFWLHLLSNGWIGLRLQWMLRHRFTDPFTDSSSDASADQQPDSGH